MDAWSEVLLRRLTGACLALRPLATSPLIWLSVVERRGRGMHAQLNTRASPGAGCRQWQAECLNVVTYICTSLRGAARGRVSQSLSAGWEEVPPGEEVNGATQNLLG